MLVGFSQCMTKGNDCTFVKSFSRLNPHQLFRNYKCSVTSGIPVLRYAASKHYQVERFPYGPYGILWHDKHQHCGDKNARLSVIKRHRNREVSLLIVGTHLTNVIRILWKIIIFFFGIIEAIAKIYQKVDKFCKNSSQDNWKKTKEANFKMWPDNKDRSSNYKKTVVKLLFDLTHSENEKIKAYLVRRRFHIYRCPL